MHHPSLCFLPAAGSCDGAVRSGVILCPVESCRPETHHRPSGGNRAGLRLRVSFRVRLLEKQRHVLAASLEERRQFRATLRGASGNTAGARYHEEGTARDISDTEGTHSPHVVRGQHLPELKGPGHTVGLVAPGEVSGSCGDTAACAVTVLSQTDEQECPSGSREEHAGRGARPGLHTGHRHRRGGGCVPANPTARTAPASQRSVRDN